MWGFTISNLPIGGTVKVTIALPSSLPMDAKYFKCQNYHLIEVTSLVARPDDHTIVLSLTDGGLADADGIANGSIVDPGGPAIMAVTKPYPRASGAMPTTPQGPVALPAISVKSATLSSARVAPGTPVTVTADIANGGDANGTARITLYVNGQVDSSQGVTVSGGSSSPVSFSISRNEPGTYTVYVGGFDAGSFVVDELAGSTPVILGISALFLFVIVAGFIVYRRSQR
jgi:hypothetical protein